MAPTRGRGGKYFVGKPSRPPELSTGQFSLSKPAVGLEPTTYGLQNRCSTTELRWLNAKKFTLAGRDSPLTSDSRSGATSRCRDPFESRRNSRRLLLTGPGGIRTPVAVRRQIYSLMQLTTLPPTRLAVARIRTADLLLTMELLYQLSYNGMYTPV